MKLVPYSQDKWNLTDIANCDNRPKTEIVEW